MSEAAPCAALDGLNVTARAHIRQVRLEQRMAAADDDGQEVVELEGNPASQHPERFEAARVGELMLYLGSALISAWS
jgi:hypothetical protein